MRRSPSEDDRHLLGAVARIYAGIGFRTIATVGIAEPAPAVASGDERDTP